MEAIAEGCARAHSAKHECDEDDVARVIGDEND